MDKQKREGILRLRLTGIFNPFRLYGQDVLIPPAIEAVIMVVRQLYEEEEGPCQDEAQG